MSNVILTLTLVLAGFALGMLCGPAIRRLIIRRPAQVQVFMNNNRAFTSLCEAASQLGAISLDSSGNVYVDVTTPGLNAAATVVDNGNSLDIGYMDTQLASVGTSVTRNCLPPTTN